MSGAGGKWVASTVKKEHIVNLRVAGYLADDIAHRLPDDGQVIPTPDPMRGSFFSPTSSVDWGFQFTPSSVGSCSTMG